MAMETFPAHLEILSESVDVNDSSAPFLQQFLRFECRKTAEEIESEIRGGTLPEMVIDSKIIAEIYYILEDDDIEKKKYLCAFGTSTTLANLVYPDDTLKEVIERLLPGSPVSMMKIEKETLNTTMKSFGGFAGVIDVTED